MKKVVIVVLLVKKMKIKHISLEGILAGCRARDDALQGIDAVGDRGQAIVGGVDDAEALIEALEILVERGGVQRQALGGNVSAGIVERGLNLDAAGQALA